MIESISAIVALIGAIAGAGKGWFDLYQLFKALKPPEDKKILASLVKDNEQTKIEEIYSNLSKSAPRVEIILARIKSQFIATLAIVFTIIITASIVLLISPYSELFNFSSEFSAAYEIVLMVTGVVSYVYLGKWPGEFNKIKNLMVELRNSQYSLTRGVTNENSKTESNISISFLENKLSEAVEKVKAETDLFGWIPSGRVIAILKPRLVSTIEVDLLEYHTRLLSLVESVEASLLKDKLYESKEFLIENASDKILSLLVDAIKRLNEDNALPASDASEDSLLKRKKVISEAFRSLGLDEYLLTLEDDKSFYKLDFQTLIATGNLKEELRNRFPFPTKARKR